MGDARRKKVRAGAGDGDSMVEWAAYVAMHVEDGFTLRAHWQHERLGPARAPKEVAHNVAAEAWVDLF